MYLALALLSSLVLGAADFVGGAAARCARALVIVVWCNGAGLLAALVLVLFVVPARLATHVCQAGTCQLAARSSTRA